jgi:hypothetical protein
MTNQITLSDEGVATLLGVLRHNEQAVEVENAIRWTPPVAYEIEKLRKEIEDQTE